LFTTSPKHKECHESPGLIIEDIRKMCIACKTKFACGCVEDLVPHLCDKPKGRTTICAGIVYKHFGEPKEVAETCKPCLEKRRREEEKRKRQEKNGKTK
jgi:hypothetical protein